MIDTLAARLSHQDRQTPRGENKLGGFEDISEAVKKPAIVARPNLQRLRYGEERISNNDKIKIPKEKSIVLCVVSTPPHIAIT